MSIVILVISIVIALFLFNTPGAIGKFVGGFMIGILIFAAFAVAGIMMH